MICIKTFKLQPLCIHSGWTVKYNSFSEYDPKTDDTKYVEELCEDLLQLENKNLLIDLGWYPGFDINGLYILLLIDTLNNNVFDCPLIEFKTKDKNEILSKIENWTNYNFIKDYLL